MFGRAAELAALDRGLVRRAGRARGGSCSSPARRASARPGWSASWPGAPTTPGPASPSARASTSAGRPRSRSGRSWPGRWSGVVPPPPESRRLARRAGPARPRPRRRARPPRRAAGRRGAGAGAAAAVRRRAAAGRVGRGGRPVLLVAEDVHRADRASLALCAHIGRRLARLPVLFVLTRRDRPARPDADALLADLAGRGLDVTEIELGPAAARRRWPRSSRSVATLPDAVGRAGRRRGRRQPAARGRERPRAGRGQQRAAAEPARRRAGGARRAPGRRRGAWPRRSPRRAGRSPPPRSPRLPATARGGARGARHRADPPGAAAGWRTGTPCSPRRRGPTCATRRAPTWPSRSPSRRPREDGDARAAEVARHLQQAGRDDLAAPRWQRAARHARSLGALPEAAAFWTEARALRPGRRRGCGWSSPRCTPGPDGPRTSSGSGRPRWPGSLRPSRPRRGAAAGCSSGPSRATRPSRFAAYRRAEELLPPDAPAALRAEMLIGLAWTEASAGDPARSEPAARRGRGAGARARTTTTVGEMENARLIGDDPARPVRRVRGGGAARRGRDRARAAARLRLRRLDQTRRARWPAPATSTPRCAPPTGASRPPAACRWWRCPAWPRGRTCWPGSAATTRPPSAVDGAAGYGRAARLGADARHGPPRRRARRPRRRAARARRPSCSALRSTARPR